MFALHIQRPDCIAPDHREESPSTGAEETARILDARDGYDHEPPFNAANRREVFA